MAMANPQPPPQTSFRESPPSIEPGSRTGTGDRIGDFSGEAPANQGLGLSLSHSRSRRFGLQAWHSSFDLVHKFEEEGKQLRRRARERDEGGDGCFFFERLQRMPEKMIGLHRSSLEFADGFAPIFTRENDGFVSIFP
uniref:Uncharacterized protein n=1 Tax=Fagus sylvatica TaxID=28930 RepID=A0A2N9GHS4_FAGSY